MSDSIVRRDTVVPVRPSGRGDRARAGDAVREFLVFVLGEEQMGLPLSSVQELLKLSAVTEVPRAEPEAIEAELHVLILAPWRQSVPRITTASGLHSRCPPRCLRDHRAAGRRRPAYARA